jgi:hypothetical protein
MDCIYVFHISLTLNSGISLHCVNWLVSVAEMWYVSCEVGNEWLNIT